jgi:hypothetical protein
VQYLLDNARVPEVIRIAELQPPYLPNYATFYVTLRDARPLAGGARARAWELLATGLFTVLAVRYLRFTPLLVCATAPGCEPPRCRRRPRPAPPLGAVLLGLLTARIEPATSYVSSASARSPSRRPRSFRAARPPSPRGSVSADRSSTATTSAAG